MSNNGGDIIYLGLFVMLIYIFVVKKLLEDNLVYLVLGVLFIYGNSNVKLCDCLVL